MIARCINTYSYIVYRKGIYKKMKSIFKKTLCSIMLFCLLFLCVGVVTKVSAADEGKWNLVTDVSNISSGDKVIVVNTSKNVAMSTTQNKNNRGQVSITIDNDVATINENVQQLTIEDGTKDNSFAFSTGSGYLYAASSSSNYLRTESSKSDNSSWTITIASSGDAIIKAQGSNTKNSLKYNSSNSIFSCYASGQLAVQLYKYEASTVESFEVTFNSNGGSDIKSQSVKKNDKVIKPTDPELEGNLFLGWFEEGQDTEFDFNTSVTKNITLIAKWKPISWYNFLTLPTSASLNISYDKAIISTSVNYYTKVTEALEDYSGEYLIVYEDTDDLKVFNGFDKVNGYVSANLENGKLFENDELLSCKVLIKTTVEGYTIKLMNGTNANKYIGVSSNNNGLEIDKDELVNTISFDSNIIIKSSGATLQFNAASNQNRFRYYSKANQQPIALYKLSEDPMTVEKEDFTFGNASLRFGLVELPVSDYEKMIADGATFGIALTKGNSIVIDTAKKVECTPVRVNAEGVEDVNGEYYQFAVVINDIAEENFASEVTAVAYVKIGDEYHTVKESKTFSIKTLAAQYVSLYEASPEKYSELEQHINALKALAK